MKRLSSLVLLPLVLIVTGLGELSAQSLSEADRDSLVNHLKKSQQDLERTTKGLSPEQWSFKPGPERWSVAECYEHIAAVEDFLFNFITEKVLKTPPQPEKKERERQKKVDTEILRMVTDRTNRVQAQDSLRPTNRYGNVKATQEHFATSRKRTIEFVKTTKEDLRSHFMDHPAINELDAHGWSLFLSGHTQRHTAQILEVKADANFPKQ